VERPTDFPLRARSGIETAAAIMSAMPIQLTSGFSRSMSDLTASTVT